MRLLALDLSTRTGWAVGDAGGSPATGTWRLPAGRDGDNGPRFADLYDRVCKALAEERPDKVIFESPFVLPRQRPATTRLMMGFPAIVEAAAVVYATPCVEASAREWQRFFLAHVPKGRPHVKAAVQAQCRRLGWQTVDDNSADACGLWLYGCSLFVPALAARTGPLFQGVA